MKLNFPLPPLLVPPDVVGGVVVSLDWEVRRVEEKPKREEWRLPAVSWLRRSPVRSGRDGLGVPGCGFRSGGGDGGGS